MMILCNSATEQGPVNGLDEREQTKDRLGGREIDLRQFKAGLRREGEKKKFPFCCK